MKIVILLTLFSVSLPLILHKKCFAADGELPRKIQTRENSQLTPWTGTEYKTLGAQNLLRTTAPRETELFCSFEYCAFGFNKNFSVGSDVFGMLTTPLSELLRPDYKEGTSALLGDVFATYQILRDNSKGMNANSSLGFRTLHFFGLEQNYHTTGLTGQFNYSQRLLPFYEQEVLFHFFISFFKNKVDDEAQFIAPSSDTDYDIVSKNHLNARYPTVSLRLPAHFEIANFSPNQTRLAAPLRIYGNLEPFYMLNISRYESTNEFLDIRESLYGLAVSGTVSYESPHRLEDTGHYGLFGTIGAKVQGTHIRYDCSDAVNLRVDKEPLLAMILNLGGSWQF